MLCFHSGRYALRYGKLAQQVVKQQLDAGGVSAHSTSYVLIIMNLEWGLEHPGTISKQSMDLISVQKMSHGHNNFWIAYSNFNMACK